MEPAQNFAVGELVAVDGRDEAALDDGDELGDAFDGLVERIGLELHLAGADDLAIRLNLRLRHRLLLGLRFLWSGDAGVSDAAGRILPSPLSDLAMSGDLSSPGLPPPPPPLPPPSGSLLPPLFSLGSGRPPTGIPKYGATDGNSIVGPGGTSCGFPSLISMPI